jgi:hypothetical protein
LKWRYQPGKRTRSWRITIDTQRADVEQIISEAPSLDGYREEALARAYARAVRRAVIETSLEKSTFPVECPWTLDEVLAENFWPEVEAK